MRKMSGIVAVSAIFIALAIVLSGSIGLGHKALSGDAPTYILVEKDNLKDMNALSSEGLELVENYDAYVLAKVSESRVSSLKDIGLHIREMKDRGFVGLKSYPFDVRNGEPSIPDNLRITKYTTNGIYILQFIGPIKNEWKKELTDMGVTFYNYIPRYNYIVRMDPSILDSVKSKYYVSWIGIYQPAYKISPSVKNIDGATPIIVYTYPDADLNAVTEKLKNLGLPITDTYKLSIHGAINTIAEKQTEIEKIAKIMEVESINSGGMDFITNEDATWILQSNVNGQRTVDDHGVIGTGIIVTEMDTELPLDHEMFYDPNYPNSANANHRKVIDRYVLGGGAIGGGNYHGEHVAGTICGDAPESAGGTDWLTWNKYDGHAIGAKLIFQDIDDQNDAQGALSPPSDLRDGFRPSYNAGSRIHTNSWGRNDGNSDYTNYAIQIDDFMFSHQDYNIVFAMGNSGNGANTLGENAQSKNVISVGGVQNLNDGSSGGPNDMYGSSSRGYADDGRIKPTVLGVADAVTSADQTDGTAGNSDDTSYTDLTGTSMATPGIAGQCAQIRQYFQDGYYPSGSANSADSVWPSAALVKAILVNGAEEITGSGAYQNDNRYPNGDQGWGRSHLDNALYFSGDDRKLKVFDNTTVPKCQNPARFTSSGDYFEYNIWVEDTSQNLEFTLVWTDYPGADNANPAIVNDLDLIVTAPNGDHYWGNVYTGTNPGHSVTNPTSSDSYSKWDKNGDGHDDINVVESVLLIPGYNTIQTGKYTVRVEASNIANTGSLGYQPFALVVIGGLDITPPTFSGIESVTDDGTGTSLTLSWSAASDPATPITYNIYRSTTPGGEDFSNPTYCGVTGTTFQDTGLTEGVTYYYVVRAVDNAYNEDSNTVELSGTPTSGSPPPVTTYADPTWNLISFPWVSTPTSITDLLNGWSWSKAMVYDNQNKMWHTYDTSRPAKYNLGFPLIDNKMGLWVEVSAHSQSSGTGSGTTDIPLYRGWNLVGYPTGVAQTVGTALSGIPYDYVETYDNSTGQMIALADTDYMQPGLGYWIHVTADSTWSVTWQNP